MTSDTPATDGLSPSYWRERAREAREAAREVHPMNRKILEEVAASYEEMADLMERRDRPADRGWLTAPDTDELRALPERTPILKLIAPASAL